MNTRPRERREGKEGNGRRENEKSRVTERKGVS